MIFKKDNLVLGLILGFIAPVLGLVIFKIKRFGIFTYKETFQFLLYQPGHGMITAALTVSLLLNALLFTIYINTNKDNTAIGIFISTIIYAVVLLLMKTLG
ncbi:MAG: hypothetical protein U0T68_04960 [Ferruginibacter sp.]